MATRRVSYARPRPDPVRVLSISSTLEASDELRIPEETSRIIRIYCLRALESKIWESGDATYRSPRGALAHRQLKRWGETMLFARHLISECELTSGFALPHSCLDNLNQLFRDEDPALLFYLIQAQVAFCQRGAVDDLRGLKDSVGRQSNLTSTVGKIPGQWLSARLKSGGSHHESNMSEPSVYLLRRENGSHPPYRTTRLRDWKPDGGGSST